MNFVTYCLSIVLTSTIAFAAVASDYSLQKTSTPELVKEMNRRLQAGSTFTEVTCSAAQRTSYTPNRPRYANFLTAVTYNLQDKTSSTKTIELFNANDIDVKDYSDSLYGGACDIAKQMTEYGLNPLFQQDVYVYIGYFGASCYNKIEQWGKNPVCDAHNFVVQKISKSFDSETIILKEGDPKTIEFFEKHQVKIETFRTKSFLFL